MEKTAAEKFAYELGKQCIYDVFFNKQAADFSAIKKIPANLKKVIKHHKQMQALKNIPAKGPAYLGQQTMRDVALDELLQGVGGAGLITGGVGGTLAGGKYLYDKLTEPPPAPPSLIEKIRSYLS